MNDTFREEEYYLSSRHLREEPGNFSPFYITIAVCSVILSILFILNIVLGCCSRYSEYWNDRHTGNRWIVSLWTATPHKQPSLDYTELEGVRYSQPAPVFQSHPEEIQQSSVQHSQYLELQPKRESAI